MEMHAEAHPQVTHEAERIPRRGILWITVCTLVFAALLSVVSVVLWSMRTRPQAEQARGLVKPGAVVSNVRSDEFPRQGNGRGFHRGAGESLRASQREALQRFDWADESRANVRIPIDDAIVLELEEQR